jgi:hypothetical protein
MTYKMRRIGLPRKILYRGSARGLSGEVLGAPSDSGRILAQGRDPRREDREEDLS